MICEIFDLGLALGDFSCAKDDVTIISDNNRRNDFFFMF